jgi:hypothetical protein
MDASLNEFLVCGTTRNKKREVGKMPKNIENAIKMPKKYRKHRKTLNKQQKTPKIHLIYKTNKIIIQIFLHSTVNVFTHNLNFCKN